MRRFSVVLALAAVPAFYACGSSDDSSSPPGSTDDGGGGSDALAPTDAAPDDAAPSDASAPIDGATDGGSLVHLGLVSCAAPFRIDTAGGAKQGVAVVANRSQALVAWNSAAGVYTFRPLDGTTLGTIGTFSADSNPAPMLVADESGHAYVQWMSNSTSGNRTIWTFASSSFGAVTNFTGTAGGETSYDAITGTHSGALSVYPVLATGVGGDQSTGSAWTTSGIASAGTTSTSYNLRAAAAYGVDARAVIYYSIDLGALTIHVDTSSGGTTWTQAKRAISAMIPYAGNFAVAVYANGDPFVAWDDRSGHLTGARYRVATMAWDADITIDGYDATPIGTGCIPHVSIDASDHLTVSWAYASGPGAYHTYYRRDVGAGLGVRKNLPASAATKLVLDRVGTTYLLTGEILADGGSAHVAVRRAGVGEPTFSDVADTGIVTTIVAPSVTPEPAAVAFDDDNYPIVVGLDANPSLSPANGVSATRCR